jgi:integrase/recombinase XerD
MTNTRQIPLFGGEAPELGNKDKSQAASLPALQPSSPLSSAFTHFDLYMKRRGFSTNTVKAFRSDLRILEEYFGAGKPLEEIDTEQLREFLDYVREGRGKPCSSKTLARRITTLKVFFSWLHESEVLEEDPAAPLVHHRVTTPMPQILYDHDVKLLVATARDLALGRPDLPWKRKPDSRPYLLVLLLLHTGIKKGECMRIKLQDIDRSVPGSASLLIRYDSPKLQHKSRKIALPKQILPVLDQYLGQYHPQERLFTCTARNLEYNLRDLGKLAGVQKKVSFEVLRWTSAVRSYRYGMPPEQIRERLGLSEVTWNEVFPKIKKLASPGL